MLLVLLAAGGAALGGAVGGPPRAAPASGGGTTSAPEPAVPPAPAAGTPVGASALAVLETLPVQGRAPRTGYDRDAFGSGWKDPDRNGCDARNDVLRRDLSGVRSDGPCRVRSGTLRDPYTGSAIPFVRGPDTSRAVQIDHVVALSDAWQKGAQALSPEERVALANDPLGLAAVDGSANASKGDGDAATWLPPNRAFRCEYVARQVSVKAAYRLWVTPAERDAIRRVLASCPDQPAYASALAAPG